MKKVAIVVFALTLIPAAAWAEGGSDRQCPPGQQDCTVYDGWDNEDVFADVEYSDHELIRPPRRHGFERLIHIRTHFVPELVKSVENI